MERSDAGFPEEEDAVAGDWAPMVLLEELVSPSCSSEPVAAAGPYVGVLPQVLPPQSQPPQPAQQLASSLQHQQQQRQKSFVYGSDSDDEDVVADPMKQVFLSAADWRLAAGLPSYVFQGGTTHYDSFVRGDTCYIAVID